MNTLECNYTKKIGLPGYSSHQFSVTLRIEIADLKQVQPESARLYTLLQQGVDASMQNVGFLPGSNGGANGNGHGKTAVNAPASAGTSTRPSPESWGCTPKQRDLILKVVDENHVPKSTIEALAQDRFGKSVKALNKLEASGLIEELLEKYPSKRPANGNGTANNRVPQARATR